LSRARWREYERFLRSALAHGYAVKPLEDWLADDPEPLGARTVALRHDVDQHPATALRMHAIERRVGVRGTWYFRWRTAHPAVVEQLRAAGEGVGLHYETLTRRMLAAPGGNPDDLVPECREELRAEIDGFRSRFGAIRSICPHGDTRVPGVTNAVLTSGVEWPEIDGNEMVKTRELGAWLTDRSAAEGRWGKGHDPDDLFARGVGPILAVIHPNNWVSGPSLWKDRLLAAALPGWDRLPRPVRTGDDDPPLS
jgi:hypothetical protein